MTTVLPDLRDHLWLGPFLALIVIGICTAVGNPSRGLAFWAGLVACGCGIVIALASHFGQRRARSEASRKPSH
jgi:hypothetical protein